MDTMDARKPLKAYTAPLFAGALAGLSVDVVLYPLDTLKTRLQSQQGFYKAGGFRGVYKGLLTVATSSMPTSSLFFVSYETTKSLLQPLSPPQYTHVVNMFAACIGEVLACVIRVPTEIAKQRKQTYVGSEKRSSIRILMELLVLIPARPLPWAMEAGEVIEAENRRAHRAEGFRAGVYRGFFSTVARDLPFSFIELPVWEFLKTCVRDYNDGQINALQSAFCGSIAGGFAAAVTTPLDLAKTRIMLAEDYAATRKLKIKPVLTTIYLQSGLRGMFAGVMPRTTAFMLGGFVFFGVYDDTKNTLEKYFSR